MQEEITLLEKKRQALDNMMRIYRDCPKVNSKKYNGKRLKELRSAVEQIMAIDAEISSSDNRITPIPLQ